MCDVMAYLVILHVLSKKKLQSTFATMYHRFFLMAAVMQLIITAGAKDLQTVRAEQRCCVAVDVPKVKHDVKVERRTEATHLTDVWHFSWLVGAFHVLQENWLILVGQLTNSAFCGGLRLAVHTLHVVLQIQWGCKDAETVLTCGLHLRLILLVLLHMMFGVDHHLQVILEHLLTKVTFERYSFSWLLFVNVGSTVHAIIEIFHQHDQFVAIIIILRCDSALMPLII